MPICERLVLCRKLMAAQERRAAGGGGEIGIGLHRLPDGVKFDVADFD